MTKLLFFAFAVFMGFEAALARVEAEVFQASAYDLRPTQAVVGLASVRLKARDLGELDKQDRIKYLRKHPVPVVLGPEGEMYMIDHHHMTRALILSGHHKLFVMIVADWSSLKPEAFWERLEKKKWTYLFDARGEPITPEMIPRDIRALKDDPYRSLAYFARENGAFQKLGVPFAEFHWAAYYRENIPDVPSRRPDPELLRRAFHLSQRPEAAHLPGARNLKCESLFLKP
ncbi:MAG: hypothetical protein KF681_08935 [Bdellovibrionaceae bacterium]|nr:hypothetical protein [Pseudobdellovibrionaceae bacterium]